MYSTLKQTEKPNMNIKLYGYWRSSASYRVRIALQLKKLEFEYIPVHLVNNGGEQKSEAYRRLNPSMLVPTFIDADEDITLNQSLAIIEYLDEKYPSESPFLPQDPLDRARIRIIAQDIACDIQPVTNLRVLNKLKSDFHADGEMVGKWAHDLIYAGFVALEKRLLSRAGKYAYGYSVSLADICLVPQVYNALRFEVDMKSFPIINKVYTNCQALDPFIQAAPENQTDAT
ncbi:MAG: maleylacetoacetate isomerase [Kangiellaceae bacterium]|jgi:maleylacetoacetate isomerase